MINTVKDIKETDKQMIDNSIHTKDGKSVSVKHIYREK